MTYAQFHLVFLLPALLVAFARATGPLARLGKRAATGLMFIVTIATLYTTPWDAYLVREAIWWYGDDRVLATLFGVPLEEYAFFVLQPLLMGLVLFTVLDRVELPLVRSADRRTGVRVFGAVGALGIALGGVVLLGFESTRYLGLILAWAFPILAFLWAYGGDRILRLWAVLAPGLIVVTLYLWVADRAAIALDIWTISEVYTTGLTVGGLPIEEAMFFVVTNLMVVFGLTLFLIARPHSSTTIPTHRISRSDLTQLRDTPQRVLLDIARQGGDVIPLSVGPLRAFLLARPAAVKHVFQDRWRSYEKSTFQYRLLSKVTGAGLLTMDGPKWLARRRTAQPAFHRIRINGLAGEMRQAAERTADRWQEAADAGLAVDVLHEMSRLAIDVLGSTVLGPAAGNPRQRDELVHATETVLDHVMWRSKTLAVVPDWAPTRKNALYRTALATLDEAITYAIREARAGRDTGELLARLMAGRPGEEPLSDIQLRNEAMTFFIAGHETVASALTWTWHLLASHPEVDHRVGEAARTMSSRGAWSPETTGKQEFPACPVGNGSMRPPGCPEEADRTDSALSYLQSVFQEALRLYPPAWVTTRRALEDDTVCGVFVPKGSLVIASPYATHRLPDVWKEPDEFRPGRFDSTISDEREAFSYFPFGGGPHLCIGSHFALVESTAALEVLASRFKLRSAGAPPTVEAGVTLRPVGGLQMIPVPRESALASHAPIDHPVQTL